ncbi:MAG: hypothetical protein HY228_00675 [Candidatus Yonathbacteria bacterium]|nr:hypothetical protein [Candidatus Yonathbacteria bacterium]
MKYFLMIGVFIIPSVVFAGVAETLAQFDNYSGMFESISLWSTIIIALTTSIMVWTLGRKMHGGVLGKVLVYFSIGMTLIFLGFATEVSWLQNIPHIYLKLVHDSLYIIGYILMGIAATKLLNVIKGA